MNDVNQLLLISYSDIQHDLVFNKSPFTCEDLQVYKILQAYNFTN